MLEYALWDMMSIRIRIIARIPKNSSVYPMDKDSHSLLVRTRSIHLILCPQFIGNSFIKRSQRSDHVADSGLQQFLIFLSSLFYLALQRCTPFPSFVSKSGAEVCSLLAIACKDLQSFVSKSQDFSASSGESPSVSVASD